VELFRSVGFSFIASLLPALRPLKGEGDYSTDYPDFSDQNIGKDHKSTNLTRSRTPYTSRRISSLPDDSSSGLRASEGEGDHSTEDAGFRSRT
jgi:hypothetical protein